jgi:chromosome segregation ATPase
MKPSGGWIGALLSLLVLAAGALAAYMGWNAQQLHTSLARAKTEQVQLQANTQELQARGSTLEQQNTQLSQKAQSLSQDRDNLLAQLTQMKGKVVQLEEISGEHQQVVEERHMLEDLLQRTAQENQTLRSELPAIQDQLEQLQQAYERSATERERLVGELAEAKEHSQEERLRQDLMAQKQEEDELKKLLKAMHKEVEEVERREARARAQLVALQKDYSQAVDENGRLKQHVETIPGRVTQLAKQHQQLLKETADVHYNLGVFLTQSRDFERAVSEFGKVIELRPDDADSHYNLGMIYAEHLPNRERAMKHFRRYLDLNPHATDASRVQAYIATWQAWQAKERIN